jgi:ABC-2 type transport system permease protein
VTSLRGTGALVRLVVARDRVRLLAWAAGIVLLVLVTAASTKGIYPTQADLDQAAALADDNPAAIAFNGPVQALDTIGGQVAFQVGAFGLTLVGLMTLLLVGRLTRGEEDSGRLELVRSMPVGRHAPLAAGLAVVIGLDIVVGVLVTLSLLSQALPVHGSIVLGSSYAAFGFAFVGITALTAQVSENPRVTSGVAGAVLGAAFVLRAVGDIGDGTLSWISPMGLAQRARPYAGERWWPLLALVVLGAVSAATARLLADRRDFGAGMVAPKPGRARAAASLRHPVGLAVRLHRGAVLWWGVGVLALGLVYGSLAESIEDFVTDNDMLGDVLAGYGEASLTDSYLATSLLILALVAAGPALQIPLRLRAEESEERAEVVLATPTSRRTWVASHLVVGLAGSGLALALGGFGVGVTHALTGGGAGQVPEMTAAALAYAPAVWLLTGLVVALFGLAPRQVAWAWVALAGCFVIAMFGPLLDLPDVVRDVSPFQHVPAVPADDIRPLPLIVLGGLAAGLVALGLWTFRRRDVVTA